MASELIQGSEQGNHITKHRIGCCLLAVTSSGRRLAQENPQLLRWFQNYRKSAEGKLPSFGNQGHYRRFKALGCEGQVFQLGVSEDQKQIAVKEYHSTPARPVVETLRRMEDLRIACEGIPSVRVATHYAAADFDRDKSGLTKQVLVMEHVDGPTVEQVLENRDLSLSARQNVYDAFIEISHTMVGLLGPRNQTHLFGDWGTRNVIVEPQPIGRPTRLCVIDQ
ncbi:MAG TPA: hypothetical protein VLF68_02265 [Candidatus Saccharimonadales bacterium]|nr:hypothetical protein [Candidatus Saccharimonadales bacterium]